MSFLWGDDEMATLIRDCDWSANPLGPPEHWRPQLKAMVRMALTTRHPIVLFWGPELICLYNDGFRPSIGPEKHPAMLGLPGAQAWADVWPFIGPLIESVLRGEGATWSENQLVPIFRHGAMREVYWTYSHGPIDDADAPNGVGGVLVICTETTEQVLAERRIKAERERFAELFDQAPTFMAVLRGPQHRIELANPGYMKLVGHRAVLGRTVAEALPDAIEQGYGELLDNVYRSGVAFSATGAKFAVQASTGGGIDERWLDFVYQPIKDSHGTVSGIFVEGVDVSERRSAEVALRDSEERFRLAVQSSSLGTWDVDLAGNAIYAVSHRVLRRDGSVRWINASGRVTRIARPGGTDQFRFVGVLADVTERQQLLEALRDADRRKDEFLATLAHELRNPLAPIRTAAHLLAKPDLSPDRIAWCSNIIARQTASMALLLDDLLEVWRISSGKVTLRVAPVDIRELVDNAVETSPPLIDARRHALRVVVPDGLPDLSVDPLRIAQILTNLLTNAAKYTDPDGHLALEVRSLPGRIEFDVADDGIGLDASMLEHVFEMFSQVSASRDRAQGGLGIGLSLSQGLAALHGGTLQAYSEGVGRGSTFRLTLPLARDEIAR